MRSLTQSACSGAKPRLWLAKVYGEEFVEALSGEPSSVFYAEGSAVKVFSGVRIDS